MADYVDYKFKSIYRKGNFVRVVIRFYHGDYTGPEGAYERDEMIAERTFEFMTLKTFSNLQAGGNVVLATQYGGYGTPIPEQS